MKLLNLIKEDKWAKDDNFALDGQYDLESFMMLCYPDTKDENHEIRIKIRDTIRDLFPERVLDSEDFYLMIDFNDHVDTTFDDIRRVVEVAAV